MYVGMICIVFLPFAASMILACPLMGVTLKRSATLLPEGSLPLQHASHVGAWRGDIAQETGETYWQLMTPTLMCSSQRDHAASVSTLGVLAVERGGEQRSRHGR